MLLKRWNVRSLWDHSALSSTLLSHKQFDFLPVPIHFSFVQTSISVSIQNSGICFSRLSPPVPMPLFMSAARRCMEMRVPKWWEWPAISRCAICRCPILACLLACLCFIIWWFELDIWTIAFRPAADCSKKLLKCFIKLAPLTFRSPKTLNVLKILWMFGIVWNRLEPLGTAWNRLDSFRTFWKALTIECLIFLTLIMF